jgi:hypothetical protein
MLHPAAGPPRPGAAPFFLGREKSHRNLRKTMGKPTGKTIGKIMGKTMGR